MGKVNKNKLQIECLVQVLSFETFWAYYCQSGGKLYEKECRETATQFMDSFEKLSKIDPRMLDPNALNLGSQTNVAEIIQPLKDWKNSNLATPYQDFYWSRSWLFSILTAVKILILKDIGITKWPTFTWTSAELHYSARIMRWAAHLSWKPLFHGPDKVIEQASLTPTIVVIGDIRRSQDLMTYAQNPSNFSERMVQFIKKTRALIDKHNGFFDKFTGDGFLVYFNEAVCKEGDLNYINCFLNFIKEEIEFAKPLFQDWSRSIRKRPVTDIGLAIGADIGKVAFEDIQDHLVAVGDAIVWASRMASLANSNEIIVNNLLHSLLINETKLDFKERIGQTKAGESFLAQSLSFAKSGITKPKATLQKKQPLKN